MIFYILSENYSVVIVLKIPKMCFSHLYQVFNNKCVEPRLSTYADSER